MQEQEIHLRDYIRVIRKRRGTILTFFFIVFAVVVLGTFTATPQYTAAIKLLVEENKRNPLSNEYYAGMSRDPAFLETQREIITGKRVARKVVRLLDLEKSYATYFPEQKSASFVATLTSWGQMYLKDLFENGDAKQAGSTSVVAANQNLDPAYTEKENEIANEIIKKIEIKPVKESRVFDVSLSSSNPVFAQRVVNTLAKAYMEELLEIKMNSSGHARKWMTDKGNEERERLEASEKKLQAYMREHDIVTVENRVAITPQKLAEFSDQLSKSEAKRKEIGALYQQVLRAREKGQQALEAVPLIAGNTVIQALRNQILQAEQKISEASNKFGAKHPNMVNVLAERDNLLAKKNEEIIRAISTLANEYELAQANEDNLKNLLETTKSEAIILNEKFRQYEAFKRDVESNRALYAALLDRIKEDSVTEKSESVNVWIVEDADIPLIPSSPKKGRNILLGLILGIFGGVGLAFFIEYLDNTVKTPEEAEQQLGLPMLGTIDRFKIDAKNSGADLVCIDAEQRAVAEGFRSLRTSVLLSSSGKPPKAVIVTSSLPGEGKTTISSNLAGTIALAGQRVLLIDVDMRKPRLHKIFDLDNRNGLSTVLSGVSSNDLVQRGPVENLSIITAGPLPPNPSELLSSDALPNLLREMRERFDMIIMDAAPVIAVTDTLIASKHVDAVILVAKSADTTYDAIRKSIKLLSDVGANVLGLVINAFDPKKHQYYGQYYGKYYGDEQDGDA